MEKSDSLKQKENVEELVKGQNFIVFGEDFARHPHALEHLLRPLFETNRFLWVETIGLRSPKFNLYDFKRILEKLSVWFLSSKNKIDNVKVPLPKNVIVLSPFMIPFNQFIIIRKFNQWMVTKTVKKALSENKMNLPITIASVPNACDYIGHFNETLKIYFCVDEFSLWPGLDKKLVEGLEKKLIDSSDMIIATSDTLAQTKTKKGIPTPVITHGVEFDHFNIGEKTKKDHTLKICYFGLFDERSDQNILLSISSSIPDCEVHIFGNVVCDIKKLKDKKNIIFHGPVNYNDLPKSVESMDIFILPYLENELTHFINPLKLKEYLSTGRPVIASALPEVLKLKEYLFVAITPQGFVDQIQKLKNHETTFDAQKVITYVKNHETWMAKAVLLSSIIKKSL